jgi:hypothetical protein
MSKDVTITEQQPPVPRTLDHVEKLIELMKLGIQMRAHQRAFFRGDKTAVGPAKTLEHQWDERAVYLASLLGIEVRR